MAFLVDTNVLVYRFDPRFHEKQAAAAGLLSHGIETGEVRVSHQAIVEFVAAATRPLRIGGPTPLLSMPEALREAEEMISQFQVLYPNESMLRLALRGTAAYRMNWFDALMWACAENNGIPILYSEDFQHGRMYGSVRILDPFV